MKNICTDPSITGPNLKFNLGDHDGQLIQHPNLPNMEGGKDQDWWFLQWHTPTSDVFDPSQPIMNNPADYDALLGDALYSWHTGNSEESSGLVVYGPEKDYTYRLSVNGGNIRDVFLSYYVKGRSFTFDHLIKLSVYQRIRTVSVGQGFGAAYTGNCFTVVFNDPESPYYNTDLPVFGMFLQVMLSDSRGEPSGYTNISKGNYSGAIFNANSYHNGRDGINDAARQYILFKEDKGELHHVEINLNQALLQMAKYMADKDPDNAAIFLDMKNWSLGSYYTGPESDSVGNAMSVDTAHPILTYDESQIFSASSPEGQIQIIDNGDYGYYTNAFKTVTLPSIKNKIIYIPNNLPNHRKYEVTSNGNDTIDTTNLNSDYEVVINANNKSYSTVITGDCKNTIYLNGDYTYIRNISGQNDIYCQGQQYYNSMTFFDGSVNIYSHAGRFNVLDSGKKTSKLVLNAGKGFISYSVNDGQGSVLVKGATTDETAGGSQHIYGGYAFQERTIRVVGGLTNQTIQTGVENFEVISSLEGKAKDYTTSIIVTGGRLEYSSGNCDATFDNQDGYLNIQLNHINNYQISTNMQGNAITEINSKNLLIATLYNVNQSDLLVSYKDNNAYIANKKSKAQCIILNRKNVSLAQIEPNKVNIVF
ncbi:hypothetical protein [Commensalibacter oyaizuii]|uniref:Uncharacterized protein n=1 Tax=Commensalibacter oyaizuii TaxID=3043873 RepID=A0ABT6Q210_9PROT|nr:hypothetical protein [Commensalibacter sp. TBRC 16381]MDI2091145.1 hypothetical protein [Commensalibacter sp. TBRC 16381]